MYSRLPKNQNELKLHCISFNKIFLKIGKLLDVRWVASSFRTVKAVWKIYPALYKHVLFYYIHETAEDKYRDQKPDLSTEVFALKVKKLRIYF